MYTIDTQMVSSVMVPYAGFRLQHKLKKRHVQLLQLRPGKLQKRKRQLLLLKPGKLKTKQRQPSKQRQKLRQPL